MGLFEQFPYSNFHELNLDWLIEKIKDLGNQAVLSVNGETGDVILYKSENIIFPDVESDIWRMVRTADGHIAGIAFQHGLAYIMYDNQASQVYTVDAQPPYPVTSVNGQTGAITLYQNAAVRLPDTTEEYTNIRRQIQTQGIDNIVGIEVKQNAAYRMKDQERRMIYDEVNTPPYPVTSVNGQTGAVMLAIPYRDVTGYSWEAVDDSPTADWDIHRGTINGDVGLQFKTTSNGAEVYIDFYNEDTHVTYTKRLLTLDDIPSGSGVVSINGLTGVVTLYGSSISLSSNDSTPLDTAIGNNSAAIAKLRSEMDIIINGSTSTENVSAGQFVTVINSTISGVTDGIYRANNAVSSGNSFTSADLAPCTSGGLNALNERIKCGVSVNVTFTSGLGSIIHNMNNLNVVLIASLRLQNGAGTARLHLGNTYNTDANTTVIQFESSTGPFSGTADVAWIAMLP